MKNNGLIPLTFGQSELRRRQVSRLNANMRLEGFTPDTSDLVIQAKYVQGAATLEDLFDHAIELARKSEVQAEMIGYMVDDMDEGAAAAAHLEGGQPITYADDNFSGHMVREWPDGRCELIGVDLVTLPVIETLRRQGLRIGLCSNLAAPYGGPIRALLPSLNAYALSYEVGAVKPGPPIYAYLLDQLQCAAGDVIFVGDTPSADVDGPIAFGMSARLINRKAGQTLTDVLHGL